jgi:hypothetical protein
LGLDHGTTQHAQRRKRPRHNTHAYSRDLPNADG